MKRRRLLILTAGALLAACAAPIQLQPEAASDFQSKPGWTFQRQAVVAAHPLAAEAGAALLREGGNAVDAAIATQLVLGLVEPQSSGIGGGGFLVLWDGRQVLAYDGRETAPAAADERLFLRADGSPLPRELAERSGIAVGVPGLLRLLETVHRAHGRLPWSRVVEPAIRVAEDGFPLSARLHKLLRVDPALRDEAAARQRYYAADERPLPVGTRIRNPEQATLLRKVAREGASVFYRGASAAALLARVQAAPRAGVMTQADLDAYRVERRTPTCFPWRRWKLCGAPLPASGTLTIGQLLTMVDAAPTPLMTPEGLHRYAEAARLALADRDLYAGDPAFVPDASAALLAPAYLAERARLIGPRAAERVEAGRPLPTAFKPQAEALENGTTHLSVVDARGMAVALTSSVESAFGTRRMTVDGYFLNNQLTDFAFQPGATANRVQGGKRPRSSMAPLLVFDAASGELEMVLGSPGGLAIPHYLARVLLLTLGEGQGLQVAVEAPNWVVAPPRLLLEAGRVDPGLQAALAARGHRPAELALTSGLHLLRRRPGGGWEAAADPRREGVAAGD